MGGQDRPPGSRPQVCAWLRPPPTHPHLHKLHKQQRPPARGPRARHKWKLKMSCIQGQRVSRPVRRSGTHTSLCRAQAGEAGRSAGLLSVRWLPSHPLREVLSPQAWTGGGGTGSEADTAGGTGRFVWLQRQLSVQCPGGPARGQRGPHWAWPGRQRPLTRKASPVAQEVSPGESAG